MTMKLYKAVDKLDDTMSAFLVYGNGEVSVSHWSREDAEQVAVAKSSAGNYWRDPVKRFKDAVDPVLIAEW